MHTNTPSTYYVTYKDDEMMDWRMGRGTGGRWADTGGYEAYISAPHLDVNIYIYNTSQPGILRKIAE